jgi:hypothetical protein
MVKPKTGRQNFYKKFLYQYYTGGYYQPYLGVEYLTSRQITENLRQQKPNL